MADAVLRHIAILQKIPRSPRKVALSDIRAHLEGLGYQVTDRTIQRDLEKLSLLFPLIADQRNKPFGWSFKQDAKINIVGFSPHEALTAILADKFLSDILPTQIKQHIAPQRTEAKDVLRKYALKNFSDWPTKVAYVPQGFQLIAPEINADIVSTVYDALLDNKKLLIDYNDKADQEINPLGLVVRGKLIYLIGTFWNYQKPLQIALHRIKRAKLLNVTADNNDEFNLNSYMNSGVLGYSKSLELLSVEIIVTKGVAKHLLEGKIASDQTLTPLDDGRYRLTATVQDTKDFRWWLLGFGAQVEVIAPKTLREEFTTIATKMYQQYLAI
jgi:predicted DNA-binding transcriptional regulator YafY